VVTLIISQRFAMVSMSVLRALEVGSVITGGGAVFRIVVLDFGYVVSVIGTGLWTSSAKVALLRPCASELAT